MKKYNRIILLSLFIYLGLAFLLGNALLHNQNQHDYGYRVETQRIVEQLSDISQLETFDFNSYQYVQDIQFLNKETSNIQQVHDFYTETNDGQTQILPYYQNQHLLGYLKFTYHIPQNNLFHIFWLIEGGLFLLEAYLLIILWSLKKQLIQPFQRLYHLPFDLANGHLKGEVKEEKSKYFGRFVWGMSQLKDTLDVNQRRQFELMKEKKTLLLSLSHDMKTPLNLIQLYSKALKTNIYKTPQQKQHAIEQIENKAQEIEKYIDDIIRSSREDILDLPIQQGEFYLQDLIDKVLTIYKEQCTLRQIELVVKPYENKLVQGDLSRSQEVLENLFENALKYGDGRYVEISFEEEDYCQLIHIYNTGDVVTDSELNHLFESFYRGGNAQGKRGNGLGLYICQTLMNKMNGSIYAQKKKEGMMFTLVFQQ